MINYDKESITLKKQNNKMYAYADQIDKTPKGYVYRFPNKRTFKDAVKMLK